MFTQNIQSIQNTQSIQSIKNAQCDLNLLPLHTPESDRPAGMYYSYLGTQNF